MNWDDLRFVIAVARHGSLLGAARALAVEHTTVGRRVDAAERALGTRLFARSTTGLVLTAEGEQLLAPLQRVEDAVAALERRASAERSELVGTVKVTASESFGVAWLAPRLADVARRHPGLHIDLDPSGAVLDLSRRQAEIAVRAFRSQDKSLIVRRGADIGYGLYASKAYLARWPLRDPSELAERPLLTSVGDDRDAAWLARLSGGARPTFTSPLAIALAAAAKAGAGIAVLPRWLGDAEPELAYLPMPDEPRDTLWLTVHRDLRATPRVRAVLDFLIATLQAERAALRGG
ncbi:MAG: LysR family transcriptional regulator [Deltaproteobacteria bacterium]|nr:LysR family transcriptional regulator [Deltaproteobacteria bacterium]